MNNERNKEQTKDTHQERNNEIQKVRTKQLNNDRKNDGRNNQAIHIYIYIYITNEINTKEITR